ncbi:SubName: Full=Uncharacterized protein {ECO:0000313/EMBL:CCA67380.1} [Serendipita indica DSM 11827]|uniref:Uncharacterized protein n=1 Tax=Serendipita indica (strain DSM 11827) TaxID=1109443 RepID=G4T7V9_SERID|nr:SubName: Full=Uncharacterized protein {ECO:0000313/EMBL:CCA67380.1} [Serendipita indica DSM 11827]CCA67380.1 hypothetical protein PIIN_01211 [Serendipita indica DSM 11827]
MEVEPLQDGLPDRYAFESDDSEDDVAANTYPGVTKRTARVKPAPVIEITWKTEQRQLASDQACVAIGQGGLFWVAGLELGDILVCLNVDGDTVVDIYETQGVVLAVVRFELPIDVMHGVASCLLSFICPKRMSVIDVYSAPAYISAKSRGDTDLPIRFLQTSTSTFKHAELRPFNPPNLILSTSAALMNLLETQGDTPGVLLLLPVPYIERSPPKRAEPTNISVSWTTDQMKRLCEAINSPLRWDGQRAQKTGSKTTVRAARRKDSDVYDMQMYI